MERRILKAEPGMLLTNGRTTGHTIFLAEGEDPAVYVPIPEEQFWSELDKTADC